MPAVVGFEYSGFKKYGSRPKFDGIIVTARQAERMRQLIAARDDRRNDPKSVAARDRAKERRDEKKQRLERELDERASTIGYLRGSRCEAWLLSGRIGEAEAEVIAFKSRYRHEFTDYDTQYEKHDWDELKAQMGFEMAKHEMRFAAREGKVEDPIPPTWDEYLRKYDFHSPEALAMANTLRSPTECHPVWFKACEVGLRGRDLTDLSYEKIRAAKIGPEAS